MALAGSSAAEDQGEKNRSQEHKQERKEGRFVSMGIAEHDCECISNRCSRVAEPLCGGLGKAEFREFS